ncbi:MAG: GNAT family N-acetyltransferase [Desulfuromonadales bacterium]|nr:GNAT family N-acetyltransferase [Desulfuromonadales bacterium]
MVIKPFRVEDSEHFLCLAAAEQWVTGRYELDFLLAVFPEGCFCMQDETGATVGFVSSLKHDRSGWIGNLLVRPDCRGAGIGEALFVRALKSLRYAGAETIWLTASAMGRPLYEKHGFKSIDRIVRWVVQAGGANDFGGRGDARFDAALDRLCWGDRRELLLEWVADRGTVVAEESAWAVMQPVGEAVQIGPCAARDHRVVGRVISRALAAVAAGTNVLCDAPLSNGPCSALLRELGFGTRGETHLMCAGAKPDYQPAYLFGLATLGSSG